MDINSKEFQQEIQYWRTKKREKPKEIIKTKKGQESVWDYPKPPKIEKVGQEVRVYYKGKIIAKSRNAYRILERSIPPGFYIPEIDINTQKLKENSSERTLCEWKGYATYYDLITSNGEIIQDVAWRYRDPLPEFELIKSCYSFYPQKVQCYVGDEKVNAQKSSFYGGWITKNIIGPFKGPKGTEDW